MQTPRPGPVGPGARRAAGHKRKDPGSVPDPPSRYSALPSGLRLPSRHAGCRAPALQSPRSPGHCRPRITHCCIPRPRRVCARRSAGSCQAPAGPGPARAARAGAARRAAPAPQPCCGHRGEPVTRRRRPGLAPGGGAGGGAHRRVGSSARRGAEGRRLGRAELFSLTRQHRLREGMRGSRRKRTATPVFAPHPLHPRSATLDPLTSRQPVSEMARGCRSFLFLIRNPYSWFSTSFSQLRNPSHGLPLLICFEAPSPSDSQGFLGPHPRHPFDYGGGV